MTLPEPTFSFTIPSLYDRVRLECRLYHPVSQQGVQNQSVQVARGAIIAHPYAPLGGCFGNPTVDAIGDELLTARWIVGTFNLRGAGKSGGRTSWTGRPEMADYVSFYGFMMHYLHEFEADTESILSKDDSGEELGTTRNGPTRLILSGYSYGSMLASYLPSAENVLDIFTSPGGRAAEEIRLTAHQLSTIWTRDRDRECSKIPVSSPSVSYLLISPILPPVTFFTAVSLFNHRKTLDVVIEGTHVKSQRPEENLTTHRAFAIYGDDDAFTSVKKLRKWSTELEGIPNSRFQHREVNGAGHFWLSDAALLQLRRTIREWIPTVS